MKCILIFAAALFAGTAYGQRSVDDVLREVEAASKELKAQRELTAAQKMEAQTGKYLANPSVEFESLWGGAERIRNSELTVMQAFDFPSAYASRNKIAKLRSSYRNTTNEVSQSCCETSFVVLRYGRRRVASAVVAGR